MDCARPWLRHYGVVPHHLEYPETTLHGALARAAARSPGAVALDFLGSETTYRELMERIERCAAAFVRLGLGKGDYRALAGSEHARR